MYEWIVDSGYTPHIVVAADYPGTVVPRQHVKNGMIVLNIGPMAARTADLKAEPIWIDTKFGGRPFDLMIPSGAVLRIFAAETEQGLNFGVVDLPEEAEAPETTEAVEDPALAAGSTGAPAPLTAVPDPNAPATDAPPPDEPPPERPRPTGRPHLRVVK